MSLQKYKSTRETTNLARVARMILGPCTGVLCALLTKEVTPSALIHNVKTFIANCPKHRPCPVNKEQEKLVCGGNYSEFDITLLYTLIRNVSAIPQHLNNWGNDPKPGDRSVSANVERIRLIRNQYGHSSATSLTDIAFNKKCQDIFTIIQELEAYLGADTIYQDALANIKTCSMDPEQEAKYINELLDVNSKLDYVLEEVQKTKTTSVPHSVRAWFERDISKWKEEDSVFLETHNFENMLIQVRQQPFVTFVGVPGSGKTTTVHHIALILQKEGYEILPIKTINQIEDYCNQNIPQVFVIDDMLGVFRLNEHKLDMIDTYSERLRDPINPKTKTLMTCREAVFKNEMISECLLVKQGNVVNLQSRENSLNDDDKQNLFQMYNLDRDLLSSKNFASSSSMFPLLCKILSKKNMKVFDQTLFISPVHCILKQLNSLKTQNKYQYASLVLLMANKNKLSEKILDNESNGTWHKKEREKKFGEMKRNILRKCKVPHTTDSFQLIDALSEMEGTYIKNFGNEYTFIHDSLFEIIAYHFGRQFPELILQYMSSNYIASYIKVDKDNNRKRKREFDCEEDNACEDNKSIEIIYEREPIIDLCIQLQESHYPELAERLYNDLQDGEFYDVFGNEAFKSPHILRNFIEIMEKKSYDNLYDLLLSELDNSSKICKLEYEQEKIGGEDKRNMNMRTRAHKCLINEILIDGRLRSIVRGVSWVIFFGHHQIFHHLLNQMIQENGDVDDLFLCFFKEGPQPNLNTDQDVTEEDDLLNHDMNRGSCKKSDHVEEDCKLDIDTDSDSEYYSNSDTYSESYMFTDIDTDMDTDSEVVSDLKSNRDDEADIDADSGPDSDKHGVTSVDICNDPVIIEQCRLLCLGCYSGDLNTVQILLKHVNTNALNIKKWPKTFFNLEESALSIACHYGYEDIVMELLEAGADVNIYLYLETPLTNACINGKIGIVRALLEFGADVNKTNKIYTPLQYACQHGHTLIVEELIKAGADVNLNVPLQLACLEDHLCIVRQLIEVKANVNLSNLGITPLLYACTRGHFNVVKELIAAGADVNQTSNYEACFEPRTFAKRSPVTTACDGGYFNVLKLLLKSGAKIDPKDKVTLNFPCYWDYLITLKRLIEMESSLDLNDAHETSFIAGCYRGHLGVVKEMIKCRADVNMKEGDKTPLIVACYKDHLHVVKELIEAGADVNLGNEFISPLQVACYDGHLSIVKELTKTEFTDNEISSANKALMGACFFGH